MESTISNIELLYERVKTYIETNIELFKLNAISTAADLTSSLISKIILITVVILAILFMNISLSLYIGELLDSYYLGFLIISGFYLVVAIITALISKTIIKRIISNRIISKLTVTRGLDSEINKIIHEDEEV